jgi:hypothetical protein
MGLELKLRPDSEITLGPKGSEPIDFGPGDDVGGGLDDPAAFDFADDFVGNLHIETLIVYLDNAREIIAICSELFT